MSDQPVVDRPAPRERNAILYRPPWRIDLADRSDGPRLLSGAALARTVAATLDAAGAPSPASIGLILSDDEELARLNEQAMGHHGPTDVLSFPLLPPEAFPDHPGRDTLPSEDDPAAEPPPPFALPPGRRLELGEIVVSVERAIDQARSGRGGQTGDRHWDPSDELRLLVIHGVLHICGWDHAEPIEREAMRALEHRLLGQVER